MMIHVFIANIFLLNYLVAILSTVYETMFEGGEFQYKSSKYKFIEKYSVALRNEDRYYELVLHPAPLNFFTFFIYPFIFKASWMQQASKVYSKFNYWFENFFLILVFVLVELLLCPLVFFKVIFNIFKMSMMKQLAPLLLFWIVVGPVYLVFAVLKDCFYFVKILCDTKEDEALVKEREEEDLK